MKPEPTDSNAPDNSPRYCSELLGARLRQLRQLRNIPLKHLASDVGVSPAIVSAWENGKRFPSVRHLAQLAKYFDIPPCRLLCPGENHCPSWN